MIENIYNKQMHFSQNQLNEIPLSAGVYIFWRPNQSFPHYIGKSIRLRERVKNHFLLAAKVHKEERITQGVEKISIIKTPGEMSALLLESRLIKKLLPIMNRQLRKKNMILSWQVSPNNSPVIDVVPFQENNFYPQENCYGIFKTKRQADKVLIILAKQFQLCKKEIALEKTSRTCFGYQLKQCLGVCNGDEPKSAHFARLEMAIKSYQHRLWQYKDKVFIKEGNTRHIINNWQYCGTEKKPLLPKVFCSDEYRILYRALQKDFKDIDVILS